MIVQSTLEPRVLTDYDILLDNGMMMPVTIDKDAGDVVDFIGNPLAVVIRYSEKPTNIPDVKLPAEETTIYMSHVISITTRERLVLPRTPEQEDLWQRTLHKVSKTVQ